MASRGALGFPILCSIRVTMRPPKRTEEMHAHHMDTCIVEAVEQDLLCPRSLPNSSLNYVSELLHLVAPDPTRMIAAPMSTVQRASHVGMVIDTVPVSCVLSLVAHVGRSETVNLQNGHKLISKNCWNVPFETPSAKVDGAPEHADTTIIGEVASYCTMENVQDYILSARRPNEPTYAVIVISSIRAAPAGGDANIYMVGKVQPVNPESIDALRRLLRMLSKFAITASSSAATQVSPIKWPDDRTPGHAKKARRLGSHPTASPIRSPTG